MQYLLVTFPEDREVLVDDLASGRTNEIVELEEGTYTVTLDGPADYSPDHHEFILRRTTELIPKEIVFEKI